MSTSVAKLEKKKRRELVLRPSSGAINVSVSGLHGSTRRPNSVVASYSGRYFSVIGGSKMLEKSAIQAPRQAVRVFDEGNNDVTPRPLYQVAPGAVQAKASWFFVEEIPGGSASDQTSTTGGLIMPFFRSVLGSSRISTQSTIESMNEEIENTFSKQDMPINLPDVQKKREIVKEQVTEEMLKDIIDVYLSETSTISLLDIPNTFVSADADDAKAIIERNSQYAEVCRNRMGSHKYVDHSVQTVNGAAKNKQVQSDSITMVDAVMERSILRNAFQPKLAAYRQLPVLEDPDSPVRPGTVEQRKEDIENSRSPALKCLWAFSCELSRGRSVSSMAWNKKNLDLLAVGYGELHSSNQKPGLVCCWSFKNLMWPERVIHCDSAVTSLDFSSNNPSQLAVGMHDGTIAVYNVQSQINISHVISSSKCPDKHLGPVWQLRWTQTELSLIEEQVESLSSVSADGRICKWFVFISDLNCTELMKLERVHNKKKKAGGNGTEKKSVLSELTPGLCFDFHPLDSGLYLVGTWEGLIHKCSCSNSQQFLQTYRKHFCPVNCIAWCPLSPELFLSCSSDWTIQLWKQDHCSPVLGFSSTQGAVYDIKWCPKWATVFGAIKEGQLEIWDLSANILDPVIVQPAAPGVTMKSLLFHTQSDCILVGDSAGHVTVYQLKNLRARESNQVNILEGLISSAASRQFCKTQPDKNRSIPTA
uniref:dynein axonemal intermediate chain 4 isoform X5 n=1 Tax=Monopterus albus TaxID=43700 RepID=UPI0009B313D3|nr:WD repeat-containing protein 78 isoform X5 [Monopterus albus]